MNELVVTVTGRAARPITNATPALEVEEWI